MTTSIHRRVDALRAGRDPAFVARLSSGWAVLGERQFSPATVCSCRTRSCRR
jgi:hypothetical protein